MQEESKESQFSGSVIDKNNCWTAFKYTKPLQFRTTPALRDSEGHTDVLIKAKEALIRKSAFPKPPTNLAKLPVTFSGMAHTKIIQEIVSQALMTQATTKAPRPDKINFQILQMIWSWDKMQITNMVYHAVQLGYHPMKWKKTQGILLEKGGK